MSETQCNTSTLPGRRYLTLKLIISEIKTRIFETKEHVHTVEAEISKDKIPFICNLNLFHGGFNFLFYKKKNQFKPIIT